MERGSNKHHFNWEARRWRQNSITRMIREHPGMILPMKISDHRDLHRAIGPIQPPPIQVARFVLEGLLLPDNNCDPLNNLQTQIQRLEGYARSDRPHSDKAEKLGLHYLDQYNYLRFET